MDTYTDSELRALLRRVLTLIHGDLTEHDLDRIEKALDKRSTTAYPGDCREPLLE